MTTYTVTNSSFVYTNNENEENALLKFGLRMDYGEAIELTDNYVLCTDKDYEKYKKRGRADASLIVASVANKSFAKNKEYWKFSKNKVGACNFNERNAMLEYAVIVSQSEYEKLCNDLRSNKQPKTITLECDYLDALFAVERNKGLEVDSEGRTLLDAVNKFSYVTDYYADYNIIQTHAIELYKLVRWQLFAIIALLLVILFK